MTLKKSLGALVVLALMGLGTFFNSLHNGFLIDDHAFFEEKLQNIKYLPLHFLPDKNRALHIEGESADPFYRPLATIIPMLSYLTFKQNVVGHHALNLALFILAAWGIYLFLVYLGCNQLWAYLAAWFYLVHPINGVAVNYITASIFPVQVMLMLLSLYFLLPSKHEGKTKLPLAVFFYLLAMLCHETAIILPVYAFVLLAVFSRQEDLSQRLAYAWQRVWPLFILLLFYVMVHMKYASLNNSILTKISWYHMTFAQYLATWSMLLCWYLSRLFWPKNIVLIMAHQPLSHGLGIWLLALMVLAALGGYLLWHYRRDKFMLLGLSWFIVGFGPYTLACFFQPIHGLMIEPHWFLFPVIGFFIFLSGVLMRFEQGHRRWIGRLAIIIMVFVCVYFSRWQNWVWGDEVRYCQFWLYESPSFIAVNAYLAKAYELRHDFGEARYHYKLALGRGYQDYISYTNMGLMDMQDGKWDSAQENLLKVLALDPHASVAVNDLGVIYFKKEEYPKALAYFEKARDLNRYLLLPYLDISKTELKLGNVPAAIQALEDALSIVPDNDTALTDLIQIYIQQKDKDKIIETSRRIARLSSNPYSLRNVGMFLQFYGFPAEGQEAINHAQRILEQARQ